MRSIGMFIAMTAMVFVTANSVRGNTSPGPLLLGGRGVASELSSLSAVEGRRRFEPEDFPGGAEFHSWPTFCFGQPRRRQERL